jgi:hypothetical protein
MPAHFVGPYAEQDAIATLLLFESLDPVLDREGTRAAYRLEVDLLPMVLEMRRRGIRIDVPAAEQARDYLLQKRDAVFVELSEKLETNVGMAEIGRAKWLAETFDRHGIKYPKTAKGNPSFTAGNSGWMPRHEHWRPRLIVRADKLNNAAVNFVQGYILNHLYPANDQLYVAEGIETALAAATQLGMWPAWALGSKVSLEKLPVISGIAVLGILVDRDAHGEAAAAACCQTWQAARRRVRLLRTKDTSQNDFNDLILKTPRVDWESGYEKEDFGGSAAPTQARAELNEWDAGDLLCSGVPAPRQWLYGWQLCRRFLSSLVAPGDVGKTTMRLTQAIELAIGRELLGHRIYRRGRVLVVSLEDALRTEP